MVGVILLVFFGSASFSVAARNSFQQCRGPEVLVCRSWRLQVCKTGFGKLNQNAYRCLNHSPKPFHLITFRAEIRRTSAKWSAFAAKPTEFAF